MAAAPQIIGQQGYPRKWGGSRDSEGHRNFTVTHLVEVGDTEDGPAIVMSTPGLPLTGSYWQFGNDLDFWAFCYPDMRVSIHEEKEGQKNKIWRVDQKFSTKPLNRCQDTIIENPVDEPPKISGSFTKITKNIGKGYATTGLAATGGTRNKVLKTSSHEPLTGIQVDDDRPTVRIESNIAVLGLVTFSQMVNTVNDRIVWGLASRKIKLSNVVWERKTYGTCNFYYTQILDFEIDFNTFDWTTPDYGSKVLDGSWNTDCDNPVWTPRVGADKDNQHHFRQFHTCDETVSKVHLDGSGSPVTNPEDAAEIDIIYYKESNFFSLGIPVTL